MIPDIENYILTNSVPLFKCDVHNKLLAIFDDKGFYFSEEANENYQSIKNQPHLYVAFTLSNKGHHYIGKSFQKGGRWKRSHAYHLGTLAYHLLNKIQSDDQNHHHWVQKWMDEKSVQILEQPYTILLKQSVFICFIPFEKYSQQNISELNKLEIRKINREAECFLIKLLKLKYQLLNKKLN